MTWDGRLLGEMEWETYRGWFNKDTKATWIFAAVYILALLFTSNFFEKKAKMWVKTIHIPFFYAAILSMVCAIISSSTSEFYLLSRLIIIYSIAWAQWMVHSKISDS